ncbi:MAG: hypothetical protein VYB44_07365 [Bacteroidota bacterium]|nr:hypothetical protein [Bacteroidota bacterium]
MNSRELRIGNFVYGAMDVPGKVESKDFEKIEQNPESVRPIPLMDLWLIRFGAVRQPWGWVLNEILIKTNNDRFWIELGNGNRIKLPFVHSLQNFFSLLGTELEIKS